MRDFGERNVGFTHNWITQRLDRSTPWINFLEESACAIAARIFTAAELASTAAFPEPHRSRNVASPRLA